jgi:carboxyl-terminal processing protease
MMLKTRTKFAVLLPLLALALLGWMKIELSAAPKAADSNNIYQDLRLFSDVLNIVQDNYVEKVDPKKLMYGAISGMLRELDPHSSFLKPEDYKELQIETEGKFGGIGIEITLRDNVLTVVAPLEGTPADRAGVQSNDKIVKIDDHSTQDMSLMEAVQKMRGPKGTKVKLTIVREGERKPLEFELMRDTIAIRSVRARNLEKGYGYIRISSFQSDTTNELRKALDQMEEKNGPMQGLILDLRNDPGGLLDQAVEVSDEFLDEGLIVYTGGRLEGQSMRFEAHKNGKPHAYPMIVLVNGGSASASEIVAGALQDHKRAVIVGEPTFGKGSVQTVIPLRDGAAIRLTTALYYTPSGRSIQAKGIEPDVVVKRDKKAGTPEAEDRQGLKEKDLPRHMELQSTDNPAEGKTNPAEGKTHPVEGKTNLDKDHKEVQKMLADDNQLERALELLKSYRIISQMRYK